MWLSWTWNNDLKSQRHKRKGTKEVFLVFFPPGFVMKKKREVKSHDLLQTGRDFSQLWDWDQVCLTVFFGKIKKGKKMYNRPQETKEGDMWWPKNKKSIPLSTSLLHFLAFMDIFRESLVNDLYNYIFRQKNHI